MEQARRNQWADLIFFVGLLLAASAVTLLLFHWQTLGSPEGYPSDMKAYIEEIQGINETYSYPYPVFFKIAAFIHIFAAPEFSVALATMLLNSLAMVSIKYFLNKAALQPLQDALPKCKWLAGAIISVVSTSLFFTSMLYPPDGIYLPGILHKYLGVFTANPFHNATYMAARPFAIVAFFWFVKLLDGCGEEYGKNGVHAGAGAAKDYVLFSLFLLLATMTKPSFTLVMAGAAGLVMAYRLLRSGFRGLAPTIRLGVCFLPTFLDLLYQYRGVFVPKESAEGGIGFSFGEVWRLYCDNIPLAVGLAMGFPILVFVCHLGQMKDIWKKGAVYRFSWQIYWMSFVMAFFLYEKGFRKPDFNFAWGYMYGIFFGFVGALMLLLRDTAGVFAAAGAGGSGKAAPGRNPKTGSSPEGRAAIQPSGKGQFQADKWLLGAQWAAYLWHLACGLYYFRNFMLGKMYY